MIKQILVLSLAFWLIQCKPSANENTTSKTAEDTLASDAPQPSLEKESNTLPTELIIKGNDIWVRDEPGTGKVVMKLNEGNLCKVVAQDQFEIIRGQASYWYKVVFDGQSGWVFGGQTDKATPIIPLEASTESQLWQSFKHHMISLYDTTKKTEDGYGYKIITGGNTGFVVGDKKIIPPNEFAVMWEGEGPSQTIFTRDGEMASDKLVLYNAQVLSEGAAGFANTWQTFVGLRQGNDFRLYPEPVDGKVDQLLTLNDHEFILLTFQDSGDGVAAWRNSYYNIFYVNFLEITLRQIMTNVGRLELGMLSEQNVGIDDIKVKGSLLDFAKDASGFTLTEYRSKKLEEEGDLLPYDTLVTHYSWDAKIKSFLKK